MFSVMPEIAATSPFRGEPPRASGPAETSPSSGFATLVNNTAAPAPPDHPAAAARQDNNPAPQGQPDRQNAAESGPPDATALSRRTEIAGDEPVVNSGRPGKITAKQDSSKGEGDSAGDPAPASNSDQPATSIALLAALPAATTAAPIVAATPAKPEVAATVANSTAGGPLTIAAAALATSARETADGASPVTLPAAEQAPAAASDTATAMSQTVAAAASDIATTNFTIAKAIETAPAPAANIAAEAGASLQTQQQLGAAMAAADAKLVKAPVRTPSLKAPEDATVAETTALQADGGATAASTPAQSGAGARTPSPTAPDAKVSDTTAGHPKPDSVEADIRPIANAGDLPAEHRAAAIGPQPQAAQDGAAAQANSSLQQLQQQIPTATVAVAAPPAAAAAGGAVPLNGLAIQIAASAQSGRSRFEIRLDPAELGRIDVRLDVDRHGRVTSHLMVEKPETLAMLRQDAPQLQRALEDAGLKAGDNGLQFSLRDQSSSGDNGGNNNSGRQVQQLIIADVDSQPATAASKSYGLPATSSGGLDIRV